MTSGFMLRVSKLKQLGNCMVATTNQLSVFTKWKRTIGHTFYKRYLIFLSFAFYQIIKMLKVNKKDLASILPN